MGVLFAVWGFVFLRSCYKGSENFTLHPDFELARVECGVGSVAVDGTAVRAGSALQSTRVDVMQSRERIASGVNRVRGVLPGVPA